ncbi:MAG TPA: ABC transporter ATP-binding protein [Gammaproteobacteria bacterium]|nr:ABC transporter ATP-binding protein [Gammaproteobacteria bacterium]
MSTLPHTLPSFFWRFIKPQRSRFLFLIYGNLGWAVQEASFPYFVKLIIDKITLFSHDKALIFSALSTTLIAWVCLWLLIEFGFRLYDFLSARVYPRFQADVRKAMFEYSLSHSHQFFSDQFSGSISSKISRMSDSILNVLTIFFTIFFPVVLAFCINIVFLYQAKPLFSYIMAGWFALHLLITYFFTKKCALKSAIHSATVTKLNGKLVDAFSNIANIRLFARKRYETRYLSTYQNEEIKTSYDLLHYNAIMKLFLGALSQGFVFVMIGLGLYAWQQDLITNGELALILTSLSLIGLAWYMGMHLIKVYEDMGTCKEALTLIQAPHDIADVPHAKPIHISDGEIVFDNVSFHYTRNHNLFRDKTITLYAGQKVGLVGYSGSGKTTFVNLILRLFDIESGRILIDGQDIKQVTQDSLRDQIALIPQDTTLFHRSLIENIRYGRLDASDEAVMAASKKAHCDEFIQHMEHGYATLVGERGIKLSGGQRQRIAIARAILKDAPILILDEATSSLDSITEKFIQKSLKYLMHNRTTIVVAHRLSTLADMDRILVFKRGQIIEDGTHQQLLAAKHHYAQLWDMQAGGFLPEAP